MHNSALRRVIIIILMGLGTAAIVAAVLSFFFGIPMDGTIDSRQRNTSKAIGVIASLVIMLIYVIALNFTAIFFLRRSTDKKIEKLIRETEQYLGKITQPIAGVLENDILAKVKFIYEVMSLTRIRLVDYIGSLRDRNFVNLAFGLIPVFAAISIFIFTLPRIENLDKENEIQLYYYIFAILFVQSFSLFFLDMFRKTLTDIKYYQNELSNFEMKLSALLIAQANNNTILVKEVLEEFAKSERNFILQKDEKVVQSDNSQAPNNNELLAKIWAKISGA